MKHRGSFKYPPIAERLWAAVRKSDGCWEWTGHRNEYGYGTLRRDGANVRAHRISWELHNGPVPEGLHVLHRCDNPSCVRPDHLFVGTRSDNMRDMVRKGKRGAPLLTPEQVSEIKAAKAGGATTRELAKRYGVHHSAIWRAVVGRYWPSLGGNQ